MKNKRNIVLIEDNMGDIRLIEEAIEANDLPIALTIIDDGVKAQEYYHNLLNGSNTEWPKLIICDLNLPRVKGDEIVKLFKSHEELRFIPFVILTTSNLDIDIKKSLALGANAYLIKPLDVLEFFDMINTTYLFWCVLHEDVR